MVEFHNVIFYSLLLLLFPWVNTTTGHGNQYEQGWIGFVYTVWLVTRKSFGFAKHSLGATGSAISSYTTARNARYLIHTKSK